MTDCSFKYGLHPVLILNQYVFTKGFQDQVLGEHNAILDNAD